MAAQYQDNSTIRLYHGDALAILRDLPDASIDAVVTDPPYGLAEHKPAALVTALTAWANGDRERVPDGKGFMGKAWDAFVPPPAVWDECLRVLRPGGHLVAFAGSRTYDLMGLSIRLAGFEVRDGLQWLYGSGFPKSLDVSKAIDKAAGAEREVIGERRKLQSYGATERGDVNSVFGGGPDKGGVQQITAPATPEAEQWAGWGTALKPAAEPIVLARKPLGGTVAANVLAHGTGALNIDVCRVGTGEDKGIWPVTGRTDARNSMAGPMAAAETDTTTGRWPSNVLLSHADECRPPRPSREDVEHDRALAELDGRDYVPWPGEDDPAAAAGCAPGCPVTELDEGGASRFFPTFRYQAKAPTRERPKVDGVAHPTVKPLELMRWLVRLVTPPGGTVLDPFAGSGTTLQAARGEGLASIGVERDPTYLPLIAHRLGADLAELLAGPTDPILKAIGEADDYDELKAVWREHRDVWQPIHQAAAEARRDELAGCAA